MKVWVSNDFSGHWPVGTAAVVVANDEGEARELLEQACKNRGLTFGGTLLLVDTAAANAHVLSDGNY